MDLRENYKKEKGKWSSVACSDAEGNTYFTDDYVEWLEDKLVKNCSIPDVVGQGEQLKAFREWWNKDNEGVCTTITHKDIERYLESL
jgi:hypothetical protein